MQKRTRAIILFSGIIIFLAATPYIIMYSMGYRLDFKNMKILATGGIYARAEPFGADIIIDSKIDKKTGFFSGSAFVQNLLPTNHTVLVKKDGYFDYQKNILVKENEVIKLENILLIKQNYLFGTLENSVDYFLISPDGKHIFFKKNNGSKILNFEIANLQNHEQKQQIVLPKATSGEQTFIDAKWSPDSAKILIKASSAGAINYFIFDKNKIALPQESPEINNPTLIKFLDKAAASILFNPRNTNELFFIKNSQLYYSNVLENIGIVNQSNIILKNIVAYKSDGNSILWLSNDGFMNKSDFSGKLIERITADPLSINKKNDYEIFYFAPDIFVKENQKLLWLNPETKLLGIFNDSARDLKLSPNWRNLLYFNNNEIFIYSLERNLSTGAEKNEKIFLGKFSDKINNCFWLNNDYLIFNSGKKIKISEIDSRGNINVIDLPIILSENFKMFFNEYDKKIYTLDQNKLSSSEKIY